ncbi:MAG: glycosyltransferase family 2 protein [Ruminococcaceae bacterium]|nr:glycosyltransferase family 2 protein [Oscillospiraceae bacterium]
MKISIIIPVYNKSKYLRTVLQEIKEQSFADFECLLIDDGSKDGSGEICDEFSLIDTRFKVFHIPNGGVSHARNLGLDNAKGEYITFIDADDEINNDYLLNLYDCATNNKADLVISSLKKVRDDGREEVLVIPYNGLYDRSMLLPDFAKIQKDTGIYGFCVAKLIKKDVIGKVRFDENIKLAEDLNFYLEIYHKVDKIYFDDKYLYYYLQAAENSSMLDADSKIDYFTQLKIQLKIVKFLQSSGAFNLENEEIMVKRLYDYVFFTIFHCKLKNVCDFTRKIKDLNLPEKIKEKTEEENFIRKVILFFYKKNLPVANIAVLAVYRFLRSMLHIFF